MDEPVVTRNEAASRFEIRVDGEVVGVADFTDDEGVREFFHTEIDPSRQGGGLAGRLVGHALKETRAAGLLISPVCPYVAAYVRRHPEYEDLLA